MCLAFYAKKRQGTLRNSLYEGKEQNALEAKREIPHQTDEYSSTIRTSQVGQRRNEQDGVLWVEEFDLTREREPSGFELSTKLSKPTAPRATIQPTVPDGNSLQTI